MAVKKLILIYELSNNKIKKIYYLSKISNKFE